MKKSQSNVLTEIGLIDKLIKDLEGKKAAFNKEASKLVKKVDVRPMPRNFDPGQSFDNQVYAVEVALQVVGTSIEVALEESGSVLQELQEASAAAGSQDFANQAGEALEKVNAYAGQVGAYLMNDGLKQVSQKLGSIGDKIVVGEKTSSTLKNVIDALTAVDNINLPQEAEKIAGTEEGQEALKKVGAVQTYRSGLSRLKQMKNALAEMQKILSEVLKLEALIDSASDGESEQEAVKSKVFEDKLRKVVRLILEESSDAS